MRAAKMPHTLRQRQIPLDAKNARLVIDGQLGAAIAFDHAIENLAGHLFIEANRLLFCDQLCQSL